MAESNKNNQASTQVAVAPIFRLPDFDREIKPTLTIDANLNEGTYTRAAYNDLNLKASNLAKENGFKPEAVASLFQALAVVLEQLEVDSIGLTHFEQANSSAFIIKVDILEVLVGLTIQKNPNGTSFGITLNDLKLEPETFDHGFVATFESGETISIGDIFGNGIPNLPDEIKRLEITPNSGLFIYQNSSSSAAQAPDSSQPKGQPPSPPAQTSKDQTKSQKKFVFGMDLGIALPALTELPLVGDKLPSEQTIAVDSLRFLISSADFSQVELEEIRQLDAGKSVIETFLGNTESLYKGGSLSSTLRFGEAVYPLSISTAGTISSKGQSSQGGATSAKQRGPTQQPAIRKNPRQQSPPQTTPRSGSPTVSTPQTPEPSGASNIAPASDDSTQPAEADSADASPSSSKDLGPTVWLNVQKKVGPVSFNRVGARYFQSLLWLLLDIDLSLSDLTLSLNGLAAGFDVIKAFSNPKLLLKPKFRLDGIGLAYTGKGPLEIGGAFLREEVTVNNQTVEQYSGAALIKTDTFALSAIGAYTELNGSPSLFIYAFLNRPLGGPPVFFVTGLALGFGYNRALRSPTAIEDVESFPLVRLALNASPPLPAKEKGGKSQGKAKQSADVPQASEAERGELLDILGQLQSYIPPAPGKVFLAVGVKFTSFKLIDSFALLIATFSDDFRLKLLGISKIVAPPAESGKTPIAEVSIGLIAEFVPNEGVLKVDGKILPGAYVFSRDCQISGGFAFYSWFSGSHAGDFVLTVGGYHPRFQVPAHYPRVDRFSLNWPVDSNLSVKGTAYFALTSSAVMAGGSLEARLDKGKLQAWFNFNANFLVAWQPFHYDAEISVEIGVSYKTFLKTFRFSVGVYLHIWGPEFQGVAEINVKVVKFKVRFGDHGSSQPDPLTWSQFKASFLPADTAICTLSAKDGLTRTLKYEDGEERWIINPKEFALQLDTAIPCTNQNLTEKTIKPPSQGLGIGSMAVPSKAFRSNLTLVVERNGQPCRGDFDCVPIYKSVPAALWGTKLQPGLNDKPIHNALCGFEIQPAAHPAPGDTNDIRCSVLRYNIDNFPEDYRWQVPDHPVEIQSGSTATESDRKSLAKFALEKQEQTAPEDLRGRILQDLKEEIPMDQSDPLDNDLDPRLIDEFLEVPQVVAV